MFIGSWLRGLTAVQSPPSHLLIKLQWPCKESICIRVLELINFSWMIVKEKASNHTFFLFFLNKLFGRDIELLILKKITCAVADFILHAVIKIECVNNYAPNTLQLQYWQIHESISNMLSLT